MPLSSPSRVLLLAGLVSLGLAACGRKGALEAPPDPAALRAAGQGTAPARRTSTDAALTQGRGLAANAQATQATANTAPIGATPGADEEEDGFLPGFFSQPAQTNSPTRRRTFTVPKEPFILDPLL